LATALAAGLATGLRGADFVVEFMGRHSSVQIRTRLRRGGKLRVPAGDTIEALRGSAACASVARGAGAGTLRPAGNSQPDLRKRQYITSHTDAMTASAIG
jgi:hypothetical protein